MKGGCSLVDISWHVPDGYLVAVVGAVGTGKSSLLSGKANLNMEFKSKYGILFMLVKLVSKELLHFGLIANLFQQIGGYSKGQIKSE